MHMEKNLFDVILSTLMRSSKSKYGLKARKDLEDIGIRKHTCTQQLTGCPKKNRFCMWSANFRGPDGYCWNIANCVSINPPIIGGLKSHDHHVLVQNLLPVALRGLLPREPRLALTRLSNYFNILCQRVINLEKLISLKSEIIETLCQLERFFPPSLFDIMFHLAIHLTREARFGRPVHFCWMCPFERYIKTLKAYVKNYAMENVLPSV